MEFALLGPLEVRRDGEVVVLRRGRPRALLIALLLRTGKAVPADVLIEQVWGDHQPVDASNALQVQVSYLRRALGLAATGPAPALRTAAGGYVLDVPAAAVDAQRFEAAVLAAGPQLAGGGTGPAAVAAALGEVRAALGLWRGEPLQDVAYEPFVAAEVARLSELRGTAGEHEIEALLLLGHHPHAVAAAHQHIADHPLRERLRAQLMLALFRSGRQADALRAYGVARATLVDELGVEPGPDLRRLHAAVLAHDPALAWEPPGAEAVRGGLAAGGRNDGLTGTGTDDDNGDDNGDDNRDATSGAPAPRLPAPTTPLVCREREVADVAARLREHRMVTLTGPGGVGKTRVALAVAHREAASGPVWLVELGPVADPRLVGAEIARAVGVATRADPVDAAGIRIGDRAALVVLDTCEHLVGQVAAAAHRLLRACPALRVLATSRRSLGVAGEVTWPVGPLAVPSPGATTDEVRRSPAVRLFRDRARAARPDFEVDDDKAEAVAAVCRTLDGLPLAIELAGARAKVLSVASILARVDDRFALLRQDHGMSDPRQRSLRAAMEWSYDLLAHDERIFYARLGVFAGRFTLDAAAAVAAHGLATDPLELLSAMVDHSLVAASGDDTYLMLDSLRAHALDVLAQVPGEEGGPGAADAAHARMTVWLAGHAEAAEAELRGASQVAALARLRAELPNLRAALDWAFATGRDDLGVRLSLALSWHWALVAANVEAQRWLGRALAVPGLDVDRRARALEGYGIHTVVRGDLEGGRRALREAVALWEVAATPERGVVALVYLGLSENWLGRPDEATATQDRAIALARAAGDDWALAWALSWRSETATYRGDDRRAAELLAESVTLARRAGDPRMVGWLAAYQVTKDALWSGDARRAVELADRAVGINEALGWCEGLAAALVASGLALTAAGRPDEAVDRLSQALRRGHELGQLYSMGDALEGLAEAESARGDHVASARALGAVGAVRASMGAVGIEATPRGEALAALAGRVRSELGDDAYDRAVRAGPAAFGIGGPIPAVTAI